MRAGPGAVSSTTSPGAARAPSGRARRTATILLLVAVAATACGDDLDSSPSAAGGDPQGSSPACGGSPGPSAGWAAVEREAEEEGSVRWYSTLAPAINDALVAAFAGAHPGITVEVTRAVSSDLTQRIDAEARGGASGADLVVHTDQAWQRAKADGVFAPLRGPDVTDPGQDVLSDSGTSSLVALAVIGYAWNTSVVDDPPASFEALTDPAYRGQIGLYDYEATPVAASFDTWADQYGDDFLTGLAGQDPRFYASGSALAQAVAAGEVGIAAYTTPSLVPEGAPVELAYPDEPVANAYVLNVLCSADHPAAAQVLANWLLSPEAQEIAAVGSASVLDASAGVDALFTLDEVRVTDVTAYSEGDLEALRSSLDATFDR